jgi:hypothetical protein
MELSDDKRSHEALALAVNEHYRSKGVCCSRVGEPETVTSKVNEISCKDFYRQTFFIHNKYLIAVSIPIDRRNFFQSISLYTEEGFSILHSLLTEESQKKLTLNSTIEGVLHNLAILDLYLEGRLK